MAGSVEDLVNSITTFTDRKEFLELNNYMDQHIQLLFKNENLYDIILEPLDSQVHSLGVLHVLSMKVDSLNSQTTNEVIQQLLQQLKHFTPLCCREQLSHARGKFSTMFHTLTQELCARNIPIRGIVIVSAAIDKLQAHPSQLTSVHADLCQLCLAAKCFKPALKYLDIYISEVGKEGGAMSSLHYLSYYYYGGMVYAALKHWDRSLYFFEQAVTCPASAVSMIMVEAYKKYLLVSLLLEGHIVALPKYTSNVLLRYIKHYVCEYQELANVYAEGSVSRLEAILIPHRNVFSQDSNMGLCKQVVVSLSKRNIQKLTKTFVTISLEDVIVRAQLGCTIEALERRLLGMIADGEIFAGIDQQNRMVNFYDDPEKYDSSMNLERIDSHIGDFMDIDGKIREMTESIQKNPSYLHRSRNSAAPDEDFEGSSSSLGMASSASGSATSRSSIMNKIFNAKGN